MSVTLETFEADSHGSKYVRALNAHPRARDRFLKVLNDPCNEHRLIDAEELGHPALAGIVRFLDTDPVIAPVVATELRFRQAIGVGVRLKMEELGWAKKGAKGPVASQHFSSAERYVAA